MDNYLRRFRLWHFCLIEFVHKGPFIDPINFGILWLIFHVKPIKFVPNVALSMLLNIHSGFHDNQARCFSRCFTDFQIVCIGNHQHCINIRSLSPSGSFSGMARAFIVLRSRASSTMQDLTHKLCAR